MIRNLIIGSCISLALSGAAYAEGGDAGAGKAKAEGCSGCHGEDGNAPAPMFPKLAGQHASFLAKQLHDFKSKKRDDPTMTAMAASLSDADIADLSAFYAKQKITPERGEKSELGEKIYRAGNASNGTPACSGCHGPSGAGNPNAVYPALAGQYASYISKTLHDYKGGERANDPNQIMRTIASRLSEDEINAVAEYASGL
jgi:cytochrome c553